MFVVESKGMGDFWMNTVGVSKVLGYNDLFLNCGHGDVWIRISSRLQGHLWTIHEKDGSNNLRDGLISDSGRWEKTALPQFKCFTLHPPNPLFSSKNHPFFFQKKSVSEIPPTPLYVFFDPYSTIRSSVGFS